LEKLGRRGHVSFDRLGFIFTNKGEAEKAMKAIFNTCRLSSLKRQLHNYGFFRREEIWVHTTFCMLHPENDVLVTKPAEAHEEHRDKHSFE
jgi:hypothetical protein